MSKKSEWISRKVSRILKEGIRRNTHKPVSKTNKRRKVSRSMARAVAESMYKKRGGRA